MGGVADLILKPLEEIHKGLDNVTRETKDAFSSRSLTNFANNALQLGTGGLVGWDEKGFQPGATSKAAWRAVDEGVGEVFGRNLQRREMAKAAMIREEEDKLREQMLEDERGLVMRQDMAASQAALGSRRNQSRGAFRGGRYSNINEGNLLGL